LGTKGEKIIGKGGYRAGQCRESLLLGGCSNEGKVGILE